MASNSYNTLPQSLISAWESVSPSGFKLERILGGGARGTTWLFQEKLSDGIPFRKFVVKYANNDVAVSTIKKEAQFLRRLQGHAHIVQPIIENGRMIGPITYQHETPQLLKIYLVSTHSCLLFSVSGEIRL
ncbi:hypothetical protein F5B21DRAFT_457978 [Xylaria acuta]|nr:hypothetical protein F5B21DRAFT_457978 [Xylaria acuta]